MFVEVALALRRTNGQKSRRFWVRASARPKTARFRFVCGQKADYKMFLSEDDPAVQFLPEFTAGSSLRKVSNFQPVASPVREVLFAHATGGTKFQ